MTGTIIFYILITLIGYISGVMTVLFINISRQREPHLEDLLEEIEGMGYTWQIAKYEVATSKDYYCELVPVDDEEGLYQDFEGDSPREVAIQALIWAIEQEEQQELNPGE